MRDIRIAPTPETRLDPLRSLDRPSVVGPHSQRRQQPQEEVPPLWKQALCALIEIVLFILHYNMLEESFDTLGIEILKFLEQDELLGWLFTAIPNLTARELLAFVTAGFFIGVPIYVWLDLMQEDSHPQRSIAQKIVRPFFLLSYLFIVVGEYFMISHRVTIGSGGFITQSGHEPALAIFFSILFILVNATMAYTSASILHARKQSKRRW